MRVSGWALASSRFLELVDDLRNGLKDDPDTVCDRLRSSADKADEIRDHLATYLNTCLIYNNRHKGNGDIHGALEEYHKTKHQNSDWIKLDGRTPLNEIQDAIQLVESKPVDHPVRQVIATSVVSHGVDMHRLNFMIVCGWPKSIAEYMQSSARSGRIEPGVVLSVFDSRQIFQSNVFLDFQDYHRFMDRMVESVPINRFAPNLLERTLPGVAHACVLNWLAAQPWGDRVTKKAGELKTVLNNPQTGAEDALRQLIYNALEVPDNVVDCFDRRVVDDYHNVLKKGVSHLIEGLCNLPSSLSEEYLPSALERLIGHPPMRHLRDIETQILVKPGSVSEELLDALSRGG